MQPQLDRPQYTVAHLAQQTSAELAAGLHYLRETVAQRSAEQQRTETEPAMSVDSPVESDSANPHMGSANAVR